MTLYLLGLDGASLNTIAESLGRTPLPNFQRVLKNGTPAELLSTYPYVTAPAWTTIFTGVNPGKHGIFEMFEIEKGGKIIPSNMRSSDATFLWDYLTWANKKSLVVGVPFVYPAPKIKGIFVSGRFSPKLSCFPEKIAEEFDLSGFQYDSMSMEEKTEKLVGHGSMEVSKEIVGGLERRIRAMEKLMDSETDWDVVVLVDGLPDDLLHISYGDHETVDEMYRALDGLIGIVLERMKEGDSLLIFSDHGFRDVNRVLFMNEWLLSKGYTAVHESALAKIIFFLGLDWESLGRPGAATHLYRFLLEHFPWLLNRAKNNLRSSMIAERNEQMQSSKVTAFSINEPIAWVRVSDHSKKDISTDQVLQELGELKRDGTLKNIFRSEEIFRGKYISKAPGEILVEASDGWLIDTLRWNKRRLTGKPLYTKKGVHKREGLFVVYSGENTSSPNVSSPADKCRVHDIVPTVLSMLNLPIPVNLDGKVLSGVGRAAKSPPQLLDVTQRL